MINMKYKINDYVVMKKDHACGKNLWQIKISELDGRQGLFDIKKLKLQLVKCCLSLVK